MFRVTRMSGVQQLRRPALGDNESVGILEPTRPTASFDTAGDGPSGNRRPRSGIDAVPVPGDLFTPEDVAERLKVSSEHVRALIRTGRLTAVNLAVGKKRPLYRIRTEALAEFLADAGRSAPSTPRLPRFKRPPPVEDHFPDLR